MTIELQVKGSDQPALVDDDFIKFIGLGWRLNLKGYVIRHSEKTIKLHKAVTGEIKAGQVVDHINRNKLDCRRANLRVVTAAENAQNVGPRHGKLKFNTSGHRGVFFEKSRGKYVAQVGRIKLGRFDSLDEAAIVAKEYRLKHLPFSTEA